MLYLLSVLLVLGVLVLYSSHLVSSLTRTRLDGALCFVIKERFKA